MVKKAIAGVIIVALFAMVITVSARTYGLTRYGTYYYSPEYSYGYSYNYPFRYAYYQPYYSYSPYYVYPYSSSPSYSYSYPYYYGPLSSEYMYRYGVPSVVTTTAPETSYAYGGDTLPRGALNQLCGKIDGTEYGCVSGLVCDYTKATQQALGVCSVQQPIY